MTRMQACPKMPLTMGSELELARATKDSRGGTEDNQDATVTVPTIWRACEGAMREDLSRGNLSADPGSKWLGWGQMDGRRKGRVVEKWGHLPLEHEQGTGAWDQTGGCELNKASTPQVEEGTDISAGEKPAHLAQLILMMAKTVRRLQEVKLLFPEKVHILTMVFSLAQNWEERSKAGMSVRNPRSRAGESARQKNRGWISRV